MNLNFEEKCAFGHQPTRKGKLQFAGGQTRYEGDLDQKNLPNGWGAQYHRNSNLYYKGKFVDGQPEGTDVVLYETDGQIFFAGSMQAGCRQGYGKAFRIGGGVPAFMGNWERSSMHGNHCQQIGYNGKAEYRGRMIMDSRKPFGISYWPNGQIKRILIDGMQSRFFVQKSFTESGRIMGFR